MRFLLVDKILAYKKGISITGIKNVTMSENFLQDHFPGFPVMPGVLQIESVFQLASWLVFVTTDFKNKGRFHLLKSVKFKDFILPGDQMLLKLTFISHDMANASFNAQILVNDKLKTDLKGGEVSYYNVEDFEDPLAARHYFSFLTGKSPTGAYTYKKGDYLF